jgi:hypothetical protein
MKKQLLIAAVAASMTSVAMADISIAGSAKVNYTNTDSVTETADTNAFTTEINLGVTGKTGDTSVVVALQTKDQANNAAFDIQNSYVTTSVGDVSIKAGAWLGSHNLLEDGDATSSSKFEASTAMGPVTVKFADIENGAESVTLSGTFSGVSVSHKMANTAAGNTDKTDTSISGTFGGVTVAYRDIDEDNGTSNDDQSLQVSTDVNGFGVTYASFEAGVGGSIDSDGALGDISGHAASGIVLTTSLAGNAVKMAVIDNEATEGAADTSITKFVVTRSLASGATFEATYTDSDAPATASDKKTLDLELAVKF